MTTDAPAAPRTNFTDEFCELVDRDIDALLSDEERGALWHDDNIEDIRLALIESLELISDEIRLGDVDIEKYRSVCIRSGPGHKSQYFHSRNEWAEKRAALCARRMRAQGLISEAKSLQKAKWRAVNAPAPDGAAAKEVRRRRGEDIDAALVRIEAKVDRVLQLLEASA